MIEGKKCINTVREYFSFLKSKLDFKVSEEEIRGNVFYDIKYRLKDIVVSISYENIEDYLLVIVFLLQGGKLPEYDDKSKTLHLNQLNAKILPTISKKN